MGISGQEILEIELAVVKRIHQLAHRLDGGAEGLAVLAEAAGGDIIFLQGLLGGIPGQLPSEQGKIESGREYRIEKSERIAGQDDPVGGTISGTVGKIAGDLVLAKLCAGGEVILDPKVFRYLAPENSGGIALLII